MANVCSHALPFVSNGVRAFHFVPSRGYTRQEKWEKKRPRIAAYQQKNSEGVKKNRDQKKIKFFLGVKKNMKFSVKKHEIHAQP